MSQHASRIKRSKKKMFSLDVACILLPLSAIVLWSLSLQHEDVRHMTDLGMVSTFPPTFIIALIILMGSFCLALYRLKMRVPLLILHLILLIVMLYGIENLVEEAVRFSIVYRHAGYTEYIMRTGSVNPNLDAYFSWPGFFALSAFVTQISGYHDILAYVGWAPVFYNLIYAGPLYLIFSTATTDKRLVWLALWFFYLTDWIWQDYFSPQGLNFFLYLVIIAILLRWFKTSQQTPIEQHTKPQRLWQRLGPFSLSAQRLHAWLAAPEDIPCTSATRLQRVVLLAILLLIFAFIVFSHPLTPFFVLASVTALVLFRCCTPRWLPIAMGIMTVAWIYFMTQTFLAGHIDMVTGGLGQVNAAVSANVTQRVAGNAEHTFIATMRLFMTAILWGLALWGALRRLRRGHHDGAYMLLAVMPFCLLIAQQYGGEMFLRIYLFSLPSMAFFAAALFSPLPTIFIRGRSWRLKMAMLCTCLLLFGGFLFTRYGNEREDYMTYAEVNGMQHLYSIAPPNSLLIQGWDGAPVQYKNYEQYDCHSLTELPVATVVNRDVPTIVHFIESEKHTGAYLIFTRSEKATAESYAGLPPNVLDHLEKALRTSGKFKMVYSNPDAQIFTFIEGIQHP